MKFPSTLIAETSGFTIFFSIFGFAIAVITVFGIVAAIAESRKKAAMTTEERSKYEEEVQARIALTQKTQEWGEINSKMVCPHCQTKGKIRTKQVEVKRGISGTKATAAVLTGGVSVLATGLSQKDKNTQAHCEECDASWKF